MDLSGKVALVTGGASGIGLATALRLAGAGATVAINHLESDPRGVHEAASHGLVSAPGDVSSAAGCAAMVARALDALGRLDYLVNNAGTPATPEPIPPENLDAMTEEFWHAILQTNLMGPFRCSKAAAPALRAAKGAVVNTASVAGLTFMGSSVAYGASKAGLINLTQNLARALAPDVRVNAVAPGAVDSPWSEAWGNERKARSAERALLKRRCTPDDIAEVIVFLLTGARMVTGQTVVVDGGLMLGG
jgi:3-oxoacyl-[acyl-carrier protein] reductase